MSSVNNLMKQLLTILLQSIFLLIFRSDWFKNCLKIIGGETMKKLDPKE